MPQQRGRSNGRRSNHWTGRRPSTAPVTASAPRTDSTRSARLTSLPRPPAETRTSRSTRFGIVVRRSGRRSRRRASARRSSPRSIPSASRKPSRNSAKSSSRYGPRGASDAAVPEQVDGDHVQPALGERADRAGPGLAVGEQSVDQDDDGTVGRTGLLVGDPLPSTVVHRRDRGHATATVTDRAGSADQRNARPASRPPGSRALSTTCGATRLARTELSRPGRGSPITSSCGAFGRAQQRVDLVAVHHRALHARRRCRARWPRTRAASSRPRRRGRHRSSPAGYRRTRAGRRRRTADCATPSPRAAAPHAVAPRRHPTAARPANRSSGSPRRRPPCSCDDSAAAVTPPFGSVHRGQRIRDVLEGLSFRVDADVQGDHTADDHDDRADHVADAQRTGLRRACCSDRR